MRGHAVACAAFARGKYAHRAPAPANKGITRDSLSGKPANDVCTASCAGDSVKPSSWLLTRLGRDTRLCHARADGERLSVLDVTSIDDYRRFLVRVHAFESAVEIAVDTIEGSAPIIAGLVRRCDRLRRDLVALGVADFSALPQARVDVTTAAQALALLFVVERNILLSGLVRRYLDAVLSVAGATAYFETHVDAGAQFRAFGDTLLECVRSGVAHPDAISAAALHAFDVQHQWYSRMSLLRARTTSEPFLPRRHQTESPEPRDAA